MKYSHRVRGLLARPSPERVLIALLVLGAALRIVEYGVAPSLWVDEAKLALEIIERSPAELLQPLGREQAAPWGFLLLQKTVVDVFGESEYALRAIPLAAGLLSLWLFFVAVRRWCLPRAQPIALLMFSLSWYLLHYSSENKQYALDVVICLALLLGADRLEREQRRMGLLAHGLAGAVVTWFSHPSLFVLSGVGTVLLGRSIRERDWRRTARLAAVCSAWGVSFVLSFALASESLTRHSGFLSYWHDYFMPLPPTSWADLAWFPATFFEIFQKPGGFLPPFVAAPLGAVGAVALWSRSPRRSTLLVAPILFALAASALRAYPFGSRLLLFAVPTLLIWAAEGIVALEPRLGRAWWRLLRGLLLASLAGLTFHRMLLGSGNEEMRPVVRYVAEHSLPGDVVWVYPDARSAFDYYRRRHDADMNVLAGSWLRPLTDDDITALEPLTRHERVRLVFSHVQDDGETKDDVRILAHLDTWGEEQDAHIAQKASAHLYRFAPGRAR